jgi:hypothetical protein
MVREAGGGCCGCGGVAADARWCKGSFSCSLREGGGELGNLKP